MLIPLLKKLNRTRPFLLKRKRCYWQRHSTSLSVWAKLKIRRMFHVIYLAFDFPHSLFRHLSGKDHSSKNFQSSTIDDLVSTNATFPPFHPVLFPIATLVSETTYSTLFSVATSFEYTRLICGS